MIEPMMATMLAFVTTDAAVAPALLDRALREVTDRTFNAITVDGECSTNDTFVALASGSSGVAIDERSYGALVEGLEAVARALALAIVRGGEGATKLVAVHVTGADSAADAMRAAKTIANSPLVKTAIHGADPNWGRLVSASGRSGARFVLEHARVQVGPIVLFKDGQPFDDQAPAAAQYLRQAELDVHVDLGTGGAGHAVVVDVRPERRVRADQRGVSNMSRPTTARTGARVQPLKAARPTRAGHPQPPGGALVPVAGRPDARRNWPPASTEAARLKQARAAGRRRLETPLVGTPRRAAVRQAVAAHAGDLRGRGAGAGRRSDPHPLRRGARRPRVGGRRRAQPRALGGRGRHPHVRAAGARGVRHRRAAPARGQRAHRRGAPVPGRGRPAHAAGAVRQRWPDAPSRTSATATTSRPRWRRRR